MAAPLYLANLPLTLEVLTAFCWHWERYQRIAEPLPRAGLLGYRWVDWKSGLFLPGDCFTAAVMTGESRNKWRWLTLPSQGREQKPQESISIISNTLTSPQRSLSFFSNSLSLSFAAAGEQNWYPEDSLTWSSLEWVLFTRCHRLRSYLRIPPLFPAIKFHFARISPRPFALNQGKECHHYSAAMVRRLRKQPLLLEGREL